jgi:hypothetical protein
MRKNVEELEYRNLLGLDKRTDKFKVLAPFQTNCKNLQLVKGVLQTRPGYAQWGTLDDSTINGTLRKKKGFDVGASEYILMHKGTGLYFGLKSDVSYTRITTVGLAEVVVTDAESDFELLGKAVGVTSGRYILKILFKQEAGCKILEWDGYKWSARDTGLAITDADFTVSAASGGTAEDGEYRCRLIGLRSVNGVRTIETLHTGGDGNQENYRIVNLAAPNSRILFTVTHPTPDSLITHYMLQVTKVLDMVGDSMYSENGNDPTTFYETTIVTAANAKAGTYVSVDENSIGIPAFNFFGYDTIPGHLISVATGGILFLGGVGRFPNRIYKAGLSGYFYHDEYYDAFEFYRAGEEDGQALIGLGICQDHLVVLKEGKTGIVANRDIRGEVVWRDPKLGTPHRNAFDNISEDEMIVLGQDGIFRIFNGIRYDREREIEGLTRSFSENIRNISTTISPELIEYLFHKEKLHIMYGDYGEREAVVLHPRDGFGWTNWEDLFHRNNFLVDNGNDWIFSKAGKNYLQSADTPVYTDDGAAINWEATFAIMSNPTNKKDKVLVKIVGFEGEFNSEVFTKFDIDNGRIITDWNECYPDPTGGHSNILWLQAAHGGKQISGQAVEVSIRGTAKCIIRGVYWAYIPKKSGNLGWSQLIYTPADFIEFLPQLLDAGDQDRDDTEYDEYDAGDQTRNDVEYDIYERDA